MKKEELGECKIQKKERKNNKNRRYKKNNTISFCKGIINVHDLLRCQF